VVYGVVRVLALKRALGSGGKTTNQLSGARPGPQSRCVCGEKVTIGGTLVIILPDGGPWEGYCPECGASLFAIGRGSRVKQRAVGWEDVG
jgi:hypothetical protein